MVVVVLMSLLHKLENGNLNKFKDVSRFLKSQGHIILEISWNLSENM